MLMDPALGRVIERCRDGDRDAFEEVVDRYGLQLLRTARLILRDQALAGKMPSRKRSSKPGSGSAPCARKTQDRGSPGSP